MVIDMAGKEAALAAVVHERAHYAVDEGKRRFDAAVVRYDAWFLVLAAVLLALGFILVAGAAVWCLTKAGGRKFTGGMKWKNGFSLWIECR